MQYAIGKDEDDNITLHFKESNIVVTITIDDNVPIPEYWVDKWLELSDQEQAFVLQRFGELSLKYYRHGHEVPIN